MEKPNTLESVLPLSGHYSFRQDILLSRWLLVATLAQIGIMLLIARHPSWPPLVRALVALAPLLPGACYIRDWVRFVRGMDELQRRLQLEILLFATLGALLLSAVLNTLAAQGVILLGLSHGLSLGGTFLATFLLWFIGIPLFNGRYR